jgi:hypothetical protein
LKPSIVSVLWPSIGEVVSLASDGSVWVCDATTMASSGGTEHALNRAKAAADASLLRSFAIPGGGTMGRVIVSQIAVSAPLDFLAVSASVEHCEVGPTARRRSAHHALLLYNFSTGERI